MAFSFRIRFFLAEDSRINHDEPKLEIPLNKSSDQFLLLESYPTDNCKALLGNLTNRKNPIESTTHLILTGPEYSNRKEASKQGELAKKALWLTGLQNQLGLDLGRDTSPITINKDYKKSIEKELNHEVQIREDKLGLDVYKTEPNPIFVRGSFTATGKSSAERIESDLFKNFLAAGKIPKGLKLATELHNLSKRTASDSTRLMALVSAVENLSDREKRPPPLVAHIDHLMSKTGDLKEDLLEDNQLEWSENKIHREIKKLRDYIGGAKRHSISFSARKLIGEKLGRKKYAGKPAVDFFSECYQIRSKLTHGGPNSVEKNLKQLSNELDSMVRDLVSKLFEA